MKNTKGITLISLIITIIILVILASVGTYSGIEVIKSSKLTAFTAEMKIMQTEVNRIYEDYNGIEQYGSAIEGAIEEQAIKVFTELAKDASADISGYTGYRYWNSDTINALGIDGVKQEFFVNLEKRSIVSYSGLNYEGKIYYTLAQLPDNLYNVQYEANKNYKEPNFDVNVEEMGNDRWRIVISNIKYDGYIDKWKVFYRAGDKSNWSTSDDKNIVVDASGDYQIQLQYNEVTSQIQDVEVGIEKGKIVTGGNKKYANNGTAVIPDGFSIVPGCTDVSEGLVISDDANDTELDSDNKVANGNQFVWVPVPNIDDFHIIEGYAEKNLQGYLDKCSEPYNEGYDTEVEEYNDMKKSISLNHGFYIGRYEAGKEDDGKAVVKKNKQPYTNINWGNSMTDETGGAVELAKNFAKEKGYTNVTSTLCYGTQWDATLQFFDSNYINGECDNTSYVKDSTQKGSYIGNVDLSEYLINTGSNDDYAVKNIYDMAGNVYEWTMESYNGEKRVSRGGSYGNEGSKVPVSFRNCVITNIVTTLVDPIIGFRISLYL